MGTVGAGILMNPMNALVFVVMDAAVGTGYAEIAAFIDFVLSMTDVVRMIISAWSV